jgi:hypothetical protein
VRLSQVVQFSLEPGAQLAGPYGQCTGCTHNEHRCTLSISILDIDPICASLLDAEDSAAEAGIISCNRMLEL